MHGRNNDEDEERRRQELENQHKSFEDQFYGDKRTTATGETDGRHEFRELRFKAVPLRVKLDVNSVLRAAMNDAGYKSFPKFFERMLATYLEQHPLKNETLALMPLLEDLERKFLKKRGDDDGK